MPAASSRQRLVRGEHLEQERQRAVPPLGALAAQHLLRVGAQGLQQGGAAAVGVHEV
jgi:hypothetical protein